MEIFRIMYGLPVTVRLLDPPLHEFLPKSKEKFLKLQTVGIDVLELESRIEEFMSKIQCLDIGAVD